MLKQNRFLLMSDWGVCLRARRRGEPRGLSLALAEATLPHTHNWGDFSLSWNHLWAINIIMISFAIQTLANYSEVIWPSLKVQRGLVWWFQIPTETWNNNSRIILKINLNPVKGLNQAQIWLLAFPDYIWMDFLTSWATITHIKMRFFQMSFQLHTKVFKGVQMWF